jgi:hypothetical protein
MSTYTRLRNYMNILGLVLTLCAAMAAVGAPPAKPLPPLTFPITGWWGPPPTPVDYSAYREAGFTTVQIAADPEHAHAVELAAGHGLYVLLLYPQQTQTSPDDWVAYARLHPNVVGWLIGNAVGPERFPEMRRLIRSLRTRSTAHASFATLAGYRDDPTWQDGAMSLLNAGMGGITCQRFTLFEDNKNDEAGFFENLEGMRRLSLDSGKAFAGMIQVTQHGPFRRASDSDMRMQAYSALAAGATGLVYFTYWGPAEAERAPGGNFEGWGPSMVEQETRRKLYGWDMAAAINREVHTLAPILTTLKSEGLYSVGNVAGPLLALPGNAGPITRMSAERALIGFLSHEDSTAYALVVNLRHGDKRSAVTTKSTMQIQVRNDVARVVEIDRLNRYDKPIPLDQGSFTITIPGGTGSLLRFVMKKGDDAPS